MASLGKVIAFIGDQLRNNVIEQAFYEQNQSDKVVYPYMTYTVDTEWAEHARDVGTVDIDIFDNSTSYAKIIALEEKINSLYRLASIAADGFILRIDYERSMAIPTADPAIRRRTVQMNIKIDWSKV